MDIKTMLEGTGLNLTVLIDASFSMKLFKDTPSGKSRWDDTFETASGLVTLLGSYDDDGIDLIVFATNFSESPGVKPETIVEVWKQHTPKGRTYLAPPLQYAIDKAIGRRNNSVEAKLELILVITDGQPDDGDAVKKAIINATHRIKRDEDLAILFYQCGQDKDAKAYLDNLDDELTKQGAKFDIVHVTNDQKISDGDALKIIEAAFKE